jgi:uncharacterized Zn finger protein
MSYFQWQSYVSVAEKRRRAERQLAKLKRQGQSIAPVKIEGRVIAKSFWGQSWCTNLERYSDYESRLPRGRTYVRNGSVVDLQIAKGEITAMVAGSELYKVKINIDSVKKASWKAICRDCAGSIDSLVELLQGRLAKSVMDRVCRQGDGLFPSPGEIKLSCSCPDWADMCKHVAAVLYGVGARLDEQPELLFVLRDVEERDLLGSAGTPLVKTASTTAKVLDDGDLAALFGLDMAAEEAPKPGAPIRAAPKRVARPGARKAEHKPTTEIRVAGAPTKGKRLKPRRAAGIKGTRKPPRQSSREAAHD